MPPPTPHTTLPEGVPNSPNPLGQTCAPTDASTVESPLEPATPTSPSLDSPVLAPQIGLSVKRGMTWSLANTTLTKLLSFFSIAVLGLMLSPRDFGLYGISFSIAAFVQIFRDGGVVQLLVQRGESQYASLRGPVFWMAAAFNTSTGLLLILLAPILSWAYAKPDLLWLLVVIGATMPLATPGVVLQARLAMQLRFGTIARIQLFSGFIRYGGTIALAWAGMGPMSFVLPLPFIAIYEALAAYSATGEAPWRSPPRITLWRTLFVQSRWLIFVAFANASLNQGAYLVLGMMLDEATVGVFFFAYQLIIQIDAILAATAGVVLFPALSRLAGEPERFRAAIIRSARTIIFIAAPMTAALFAGFGAFEDVLWHNRWDVALAPVQALSLLYAARVLFMLPSVSLLAQGRFKDTAINVLACGSGMMLATIIGALISPTAESIAVWLGGYIGVACIAFSIRAVRRSGVTARDFLAAIFPAWIASWVAAAAAVAVDVLLRPYFSPAPGTAIDWLARSGIILPFGAAPSIAHDPAAGIMAFITAVLKLVITVTGGCRLIIIAAVLAALYLGLLRCFFAPRLREGLYLAPMRFHRLIDRLFFLPRA